MSYIDEYDPFYYAQSSGYFGVRLNPNHMNESIDVYWNIVSQNIVENYSTVRFKICCGSGVTTSELRANGSTKVQLYVDDVKLKDYHFISNTQVEYYTLNLYHNRYGQRYMKPDILFYDYGTNKYSDLTLDNTAIGLKVIPQGARLDSAPLAFNDEANPVISYRSYVNEATAIITTNTNLQELDTIISHTLPLSSETTTYTFELTEEERDALRLRCKNSNSMKLYFGVYCEVNGEVIYTNSETTFSVINANPTAIGTVKDINPATLALTGDENTLIRFASTAAVSAQFTAIKKATIVDYWIEYNSNILPKTYQEFEKVEGNIFTFHITDSRGNIGESFVQAPMIEYTKLTCNIDTTQRPDIDGVMNIKCSGNYYNGAFSYTDDAVANTLQVQYRHKIQGADYTDWIDLPYTIRTDGTYDASIALTLENFDYTQVYVFQCRAIDKLNNIQSVELASKSLPVFHWGENDFVFEVPVTFNSSTSGIVFPPQAPDYSSGGSMNGDLDITGDLRLKGEGNYGNSIYFGDKEYASIQELTDNALTVTASTINLSGSVKLNDQPLEFGVWQPTLDNHAISSYTSNSGWYQRIGNVITVGFFIKATSRNNHHTTGIVIEGLPAIPASTAAGGGMCSGVYKSAGFGFQCWAAETNGTITARVQDTDDSNATNLATSASGLFYPYGGGEITLSGTITYMVE